MSKLTIEQKARKLLELRSFMDLLYSSASELGEEFSKVIIEEYYMPMAIEIYMTHYSEDVLDSLIDLYTRHPKLCKTDQDINDTIESKMEEILVEVPKRYLKWQVDQMYSNPKESQMLNQIKSTAKFAASNEIPLDELFSQHFNTPVDKPKKEDMN